MLPSWTQQEKAQLVHILQTHPSSWTLHSLAADIPSKSLLEISLFVDTLCARVPALFKPTDAARSECPTCTHEASGLQPPAAADTFYMELLDVPALLRWSHDAYTHDPRTSIERAAIKALAVRLHRWLVRMVRCAGVLAVERRKQMLQMHRHRPASEVFGMVVKVASQDVLDAVALVDSDSLPPEKEDVAVALEPIAVIKEQAQDEPHSPPPGTTRSKRRRTVSAPPSPTRPRTHDSDTDSDERTAKRPNRNRKRTPQNRKTPAVATTTSPPSHPHAGRDSDAPEPEFRNTATRRNEVECRHATEMVDSDSDSDSEFVP
ncbi:hypothetical protein DFJ77DRAFT_444914 [Powellomyces hirtus]|nr:hypothetical protein DFJ77DRAFT_444914 [Powellomyces hirtus]